MSDLFHHAAILRATYHRAPGFNLFSVLRSHSDEVLLHSRFLAHLLNPDGSHGCGDSLLRAFLETVGVRGFDSASAKVQAEYKNIDIFIHNTQGQALVIENKIYARDAYEQIYRYDQLVKREGYRQTWNLYLTLDGSEPAEHSKKGLEVSLVSYETDIVRWLEKCLTLAAREPGLREALFQYIELLQKLTSTDQGGQYMDELKKKLLEGDNLLRVQDIKRAFKEVQIDLQVALWQRMRDYQKAKYPEMPKLEDTADKDTIRNYYSKSKNNRYYGLYYALSDLPGYAYVELNHQLYIGIHPLDEGGPNAAEQLRAISSDIPFGENEVGDFYWRYPAQKINLKNPQTLDLELLRDPAQQQAMAQDLIDGVHALWSVARKSTAP